MGASTRPSPTITPSIETATLLGPSQHLLALGSRCPNRMRSMDILVMAHTVTHSTDGQNQFHSYGASKGHARQRRGATYCEDAAPLHGDRNAGGNNYCDERATGRLPLSAGTEESLLESTEGLRKGGGDGGEICRVVRRSMGVLRRTVHWQPSRAAVKVTSAAVVDSKNPSVPESGLVVLPCYNNIKPLLEKEAQRDQTVRGEAGKVLMPMCKVDTRSYILTSQVSPLIIVRTKPELSLPSQVPVQCNVA